MEDVLATTIKALNGGLFVVAFAIVGEMAVPKRFAGLFSAAPSIALANLTVILVFEGTSAAQHQSTGMVVGAVAFVVACLVGGRFIQRYRAARGSLAICALWLVLAVAGLGMVLR